MVGLVAMLEALDRTPMCYPNAEYLRLFSVTVYHFRRSLLRNLTEHKGAKVEPSI
jgi:hypothetical protein